MNSDRTSWSDTPVDQLRLADQSLAATLGDLLEYPFEIFLGLLVCRQRVDRILHGDRSQRPEPPPDLDS